jgi:hypothetical protein
MPSASRSGATSSSSPFRSVLLLLCVVAAVVVYVVMKHRAAASDVSARRTPTAAPPERTAGSERERPEQVERTMLLQRRVATLESDVTALQDEREAAQSRDASALHRQAGTRGSIPPGDPEMLAQQKREEQRMFLQIGRSFSAQPIDQVWSESMTARIGEHLRTQPLENSRVENMECRSSMCRIEISVHDGADLATIRDGLRLRMADVMGSGASKQDETGNFVVYLAKDPQALGMTAQP